LIYLHSEYETTVERGLEWTRAEYEDQQPRLVHARKHANLEIATDDPSPETVLMKVLDYLTSSSC